MYLRTFAIKLPSAAWAVLAFLFLLVSLSGDSIDMVEGQTWAYARLISFPDFCHQLRTDSTQVAQMPLGMFSFWAWAQAFGTSELAMRSLNLIWAAIAILGLARAGRQLSIPWLPMLFAVQPLVWYYMNCAQTPIMQMAGGALLLGGALGFLTKGSKSGMDGIFLCLGGVLLSGAHMFGLVPLVAVALGLAVRGVWNKLRLPLSSKIALFLGLSIVTTLAAYYLTTLLRGVAGVKLWMVSPANLLFVVYEFLGLQGLGPGRQELRAMLKGFTSTRELLAFLPGLLIFCSSYLLLFATAFKSWMTRGNQIVTIRPPQNIGSTGQPRSLALASPWLMGIGVPLLSSLLLFLLAVTVGIPFWGRDLAGAFPFWVLGLAVTLRWARQGLWRKAGRWACRGILLLLATSSVLLRFAPWHRHDDYRGAVAEAKKMSATGRTVWRVADYSAGIYYELPLVKEFTGAPGEIQFSMNRMAGPGDLPGAIIISRPENFDSLCTATRLARSGDYTKTKSLQAFDVWEKRGREY